MEQATGFPREGRVPADTLPHRLILVREEMGWSQREAAAECNITFGEWQSMENGAKARGLDEKIGKIADRTGYSRIWLMWGGPLASEPYPSDPHATDTRTRRQRKGSSTPKRHPDGPRDFRYVTPPSMPNDRVKVAA